MDKLTCLVRKTYKKIGAREMASLTNWEKDSATLRYVLHLLNKKDDILDLACGYGRITIPLAKRGFNVKGLDLISGMISQARKNARKEQLDIEFKIGDMRKLPYKNESFNKIICLWSSFNHLLTRKDQLLALNEIYRVLKKNGICMIEMPNGESKWIKSQIAKQGRVVSDIICDTEVINYIHDRDTLKKLFKVSKFNRYIVKFANLAHRKRIIAILKK